MPGYVLYIPGEHDGDQVCHNRWIDRRDCVTDYQTNLPHQFSCTQVVHFTDNEFASRIGSVHLNDPFCFQAKKWEQTELNLTWWAALPPNNYQSILKTNLSCLWPNTHQYIGSSPAFKGDSLCGPVGFVMPWEEMLKQYAMSRQSILENVECRILGTIAYSREIMYAVLVCIQGDEDVERFPLTGMYGTEAFEHAATDKGFIWKVFSTVSKTSISHRDIQWAWDHVSFGFNFPSGDLKLPAQFCSIKTKTATPFVPFSRPNRMNRTLKNQTFDSDVVEMLEDKIYRLRPQ